MVMKDEYTAKDFGGAVRGRFYGKLIRDGKYWVRIHHSDHIELRQVEAATGQILSSAIMPKEAATKEAPEVLV
jgi:hypothetical protein